MLGGLWSEAWVLCPGGETAMGRPGLCQQTGALLCVVEEVTHISRKLDRKVPTEAYLETVESITQVIFL